ncbi:L,D-transpeptidase [Solemya velum gill symbiont]|nr:L,D-transpeptidase [Solemya velum gill symbiont]
MNALYSKVTSLALFLSLILLATGCVPQQMVKSGNASSKSNPMYDTSYSKEADVEFVLGQKAAETYVSNKAFASLQDKFKSESASRRTRDMADWVVSSRDNRNMPFAIIDKVNAKVYAFNPSGKLYGAAPVLLGLAKGDYSVPGIGDKPLSQIKRSERTTPAGRFVSKIGRNHKGKEILWVDYDQALSLHPVVRGVPSDRRAQRLSSLTSSDNRISFGCINVPKPFFKNVISEKYSGQSSVVYILPETKQFKKS